MNFSLNPTLEQDTYFIKDLPLCKMLLMDNALFPWIILVPRLENAAEITDLSPEQQLQLWAEISETSKKLQVITGAYKMNIAALGNVVRQLHIHIIARHQEDAAWPQPVWGSKRECYEKLAAEEFIALWKN